MDGSTSKTSFGPAAGSVWNVNTAGNIIMPAIMATIVSSAAVVAALFINGVSFEK